MLTARLMFPEAWPGLSEPAASPTRGRAGLAGGEVPMGVGTSAVIPPPALHPEGPKGPHGQGHERRAKHTAGAWPGWKAIGSAFTG